MKEKTPMPSDRPQLRWNDGSSSQSTSGPSSLETFHRQRQQSIDAHQYARELHEQQIADRRQQQIGVFITQQQIAAWSRWLNDPNAQGYLHQWLRGLPAKTNQVIKTVVDAYDFVSKHGDLKECNKERIQHAEQKIVFEGSRDIPQHMRSFDGADLIDPDELRVAMNGVDLFKRVAGSAPEDIRQFFLRGMTGPRLQAMFLGTKPVIFDLTNQISIDASAISHIDTDNDDVYRKYLAEVVEQTYQKIKDHIIQTDTSRDIRFIDLTARDYLDKSDLYSQYR